MTDWPIRAVHIRWKENRRSRPVTWTPESGEDVLVVGFLDGGLAIVILPDGRFETVDRVNLRVRVPLP